MRCQLGNVKNLEKNIHKQIIYFLKSLNYFCFHVANEVNTQSLQSGYNNARFFVDRKNMGVTAGVPDICVILKKGTTIWLEVKSEKGRLTDSQKEFHAKLLELNHKVYVVRSVEDVQEILKDYEPQ